MSRNDSLKSLKPLGLILAGGQSKRLFPLEIPKPLLKIKGKFLLQGALERLKGFDTWVVTSPPIAREIRMNFHKNGLTPPRFILEPESRDTAAAVGFALQQARVTDRWVAILSADQWIPETVKFRQFLKSVRQKVKHYPESLFVAGSPSSFKSPESYTQFGWVVQKNREKGVVEEFVEKPSQKKVRSILRRGGLINAGMFFGQIKTFLMSYKRFYPNVLKKNFPYYRLERLPIDKAIFENYKNVRIMPFNLKWEDLGTWQDWYDQEGGGHGVRVNTRNVFIHSDPGFQVFAFDINDLGIIQNKNKVLVIPLSKVRDLKKYLEKVS